RCHLRCSRRSATARPSGQIRRPEPVMSTPASVGGHPIHPMLVGLPIGLWIFSFVSDIGFLAGWAGRMWKIVASYTIAAGVVGALLAAVPGFIDFLSITDRRV